MNYFPKELELNHDNIWFLDKKKINIQQIVFEYPSYTFIPRSKFYKIEGNDEYIIKVHNEFIFFEEVRIKRMLKKFYEVSDKLSNIDFPIAYYQENSKLRGLVIPYYDKGISIRNVIKSNNSEKFMSLYNHSNNLEENFMYLYLEILSLLEKMYQEKISYLDIHGGNFIIYQNQIKVIDFDPRYVKFNNMFYESYIINKYCHLINDLNTSFKLKNKLIFPKDNFENMKNEIKRLIK